MTDVIDDSLWTRRATSWVIGAFSAIALLMAIAGIYGVISYSVGQRSREIGVRLAMGADKARVLREVVGEGMTIVGVGAVVGLGLSAAAASLVAGILVEVSATSPAVYATVTAVVFAVAALANYVPARRASGLDPVVVLRGE
jgi:putative ABC transport system permease protein